jgi:hypothetical protein
MAVPKWKQEAMERKQKEEEARLQAERDRIQGSWMDNLVGAGQPSWMKDLKDKKKQTGAPPAAAPEFEAPEWKRALQQKKATEGDKPSDASAGPVKPQVRLY